MKKTEKCYTNRELSWLQFNERVLNEAGNPRVPLAERMTFASIYQTNLDEFFMVRVGTLMMQMNAKEKVIENKTGMTSEEQVKELIEQGHTQTIRGFKSKAGKRFDAKLKVDKDENGKVYIAFDFSDVEPEIIPEVKCPVCGGQMKKTSFGYGCVNFSPDDENSCRFSIGTIAGKTLPVTAVKQLLTDGHTDTLRGFKSKTGKKFDACLKLEKTEEGKTNIVFDFDSVEQKVIRDVKCPLCGGEIIATSFGYGCANYKPGDENSCRFSIGKMAEKSFTEAQVRQLLNDGITETMRGFKSKTGKKFDARVALAKDENGKVTGLKFDFDNVEPKKVKDVKCPKCGGDIVVAPFGFMCANHKKDDKESCSFMIGSIASVRLKEAQVKELLMKKKGRSHLIFRRNRNRKRQPCRARNAAKC